MIYINLFGNPPPQKLIDKGKKLTEKLKKLSSKKRSDFIEKHKKYWNKLKDHYIKLSHGRCWYTGAIPKISHYEMDHYRPKKSIKELDENICSIKTSNKKGSYWWLAFDWKNLRLSGAKPNKKKSSYFPLREGTNCAIDKESTDNESPGLLDPINIDDVNLITFDESGMACAACSDDTSWNAMRVKISVFVYGLNDNAIVEKRKVLRNRCKYLLKKINEKSNTTDYKNHIIDLLNEKEYNNISYEVKKKLISELMKLHQAEIDKDINDYIEELKEKLKPDFDFTEEARIYIQQNSTQELFKKIIVN